MNPCYSFRFRSRSCELKDGGQWFLPQSCEVKHSTWKGKAKRKPKAQVLGDKQGSEANEL